jgi:hypothetical protein
VEQDGRRPLHGLVEDGEGQGIPEELPRRLSLAAAAEVLGQGEAGRPPPEPDGEAHPHRLQLHGQRHAEAEEAREQVQRRDERRAIEGRGARGVHPLQPEVLLEGDEVAGSRPLQKVERRGVGPEHEVGAVVDVLAGDRVAGRGGPSAEDAAALEEHDVVPPLLQRDGRGEPGEASPDDDDLHTPQ